MQRRTSLAVTIGVALAAVVAFATLGGTGLAGGLAKPVKSNDGPGQYQYGAKVTICHKDKVTIRVSINAWKAHRAQHDDTLGPCANAKGKAGKADNAAAKAEKSAASRSDKAAKASKPAKPEKAATSDSATASAVGGNGNGNANGHAKEKKKG